MTLTDRIRAYLEVDSEHPQREHAEDLLREALARIAELEQQLDAALKQQLAPPK